MTTTTATTGTITSNFRTSAAAERNRQMSTVTTTYADDDIITTTNNTPIPSHQIYFNDQHQQQQPQIYQNLSLVRPDDDDYDAHLAVFNHSENHLITSGRTSVENLTTLDDDHHPTHVHYPSNVTDSFLSLLPTEFTTIPSTTTEFNETFMMKNITATAMAINETSTTISNDYFNNISWSKGCAVTIFVLLILITVIGNTLVILSVLTTRRLRTVTNCFVMNLAITDWLVGIFVMPPAVIIYIVGSWRFGWILCDIWISLDVLLCTASILSLCAISLDRYLAVIQPLTYSKKRRSKRLAMFMIFIVWIVAFSITCPPFLGWYEPGRRQSDILECRYNHNKGYVVFSAMGSFFIPMTVMLYVYLNIGFVLTSRRQRINLTEASEKSPENDADCENFLTETEHIIHQCSPKMFHKYKSSKTFDNNDLLASHSHQHPANILQEPLNNTGVKRNSSVIDSTTLYELIEISRSSSMIRCSTISCKYSANGTNGLKNDKIPNNGNGNSGGGTSACISEQIPMEQIHYSQSHTSFSESNLSAAKYKVSHHQPHQPLQHNMQQHIFSCGGGGGGGKSQRVPPMRISTQKRDTKTAKTLSMVMGGFIVCWLPFFTYYILIPFLPPEGVSESLMSFLTWVGWVNCAINPFIYAFYNPDFRTAFWRLTFRRMCKKPANHLKMFKG